jgi:excinuclease ABC subunit C
MVVFENGKPLKKEYRRFRIRIAQGGDDSDSLKEVIFRRMKRGLAADPGFSIMPDLLLVDGGQQQVGAARRILENLGLEIPTAGIVKDDKHRTRGFLYNDHEVTRNENPVLLRHLATVQEEVHRYAVEYLRGIRSKQMKRSALDDVPGIGEKRKQALFERFGSIEAMRDAEQEELSAVPGMNRKVSETLKKHLNNKIVNPRK